MLGDSPAVGLAIDACIGDYEERNAPICNEGGNYIGSNGHKIRVYQHIDSRFILEDMFAKLHIFYGKQN